jgi:ATP-dependent DNA helicase RecG
VISAAAELAATSLLSPKETAALSSVGMTTAAEVLQWFPKRYEDRRRFDAFPIQQGGAPVCLRGMVVDAALRHFGPARKFYEAVVMDGSGGLFGSGKVTCRWFNMPFIHKLIASGHEVIVYGKVKEVGGRLVIDHPEIEILREDEGPSIHLERIVPVYRKVAGISQRRLREIQHLMLHQVEPESLDWCYDVDPSRPRAADLRSVHFPESLAESATAKRRFALEEFFAMQLNVVWRRARHDDHPGRIQGVRTTLLKRFYENLPFDLTGAQKRSIREIIADLRSPRAMNRLLQGDVGSGKTFVAMAAMLLAVDSGSQAALMAPTQILAEQHFLTFRRWLEPLGIRITLLTAAREESTHLDLEGEAQIVIGTHALLYSRLAFRDLGLVVIDEQHKFGVAQRGRLISQGGIPDVLVMTATPIPRTLTLTIYGDLDVSVLDEKPAGRGKIITALRVGAKQSDINKFVKSQLAEGRQAYFVYPLVEESENLKAESVTEAFPKWQKRLAGREVGLLHGKIPPEEKESVMRRFREGEVAALVSTTVIEVGVDVPNASVMILHHAERFGLAQLHQLRGRIGRGGHKGYCILLTDGKSPEAMEKLRVLEQTSDGFEIAEADLKLRGPGDVLGSIQSGAGEMRFVDYLSDISLIRQARALAEKLISEDKLLNHRYQALKLLIITDSPAALLRD